MSIVAQAWDVVLGPMFRPAPSAHSGKCTFGGGNGLSTCELMGEGNKVSV